MGRPARRFLLGPRRGWFGGCCQSFAQFPCGLEVRRQGTVGAKCLENELRQISGLEFATGEDQDKIFGGPDVDALTTAANGFEHARIIIAFDPPGVSIMILVDGLPDMACSG